MKWTEKQIESATWDAGRLCSAQSGTVEKRLVDTTIELAAQRNALRDALKLFLSDERFQVMVGGNPNVVQQMFEQARAALLKVEE